MLYLPCSPITVLNSKFSSAAFSCELVAAKKHRKDGRDKLKSSFTRAPLTCRQNLRKEFIHARASFFTACRYRPRHSWCCLRSARGPFAEKGRGSQRRHHGADGRSQGSDLPAADRYAFRWQHDDC